MKQQPVLIGAIVLTILGTLGYLMWNRPVPTQQSSTQSQQLSPTPSQTAASQPDGVSLATGHYITYTPTIIAETAGTKILFFHAPWCPQCRALEASIKASTIPTGVTIIKVDYDTNQGLRKQYGVTLQTTLVQVDDQGNLIEKFVAYDEPNFQSIERLLN